MRSWPICTALLPLVALALEAPTIGIEAAATQDSVIIELAWTPVPEAGLYRLHGRLQVDAPDSLLLETAGRQARLAFAAGMPRAAAFRVVAVAETLAGFVRVPAGTFVMGRVGWAGPEHLVTLTHPFQLGRHEITNAQYLEALNWALAQGRLEIDQSVVRQYGVGLLAIGGAYEGSCEIVYDGEGFSLQAGVEFDDDSGPGFAYPDGYDPAEHPVTAVSWYGAACYCDWRSEMEGLPPYYAGDWEPTTNPYQAEGYRLPTEAEWERAARFDDGRFHPWGAESPDCDLANHRPDFIGPYCVGWTAPVGSLLAGASELGLTDLCGNAMEWCHDWFAFYTSEAQVDPAGGGGNPGWGRVQRGGAWFSFGTSTNAIVRSQQSPTLVAFGTGFRACRLAN